MIQYVNFTRLCTGRGFGFFDIKTQKVLTFGVGFTAFISKEDFIAKYNISDDGNGDVQQYLELIPDGEVY